MPYGSTSHLGIALSAAVPLRIIELQQIKDIPERAKVMQAWAAEANEVLQDTGEAILFRTANSGQTAVAFNAAAKGIAALAFVPGGITIFGQHWEAQMDAPPIAKETPTDGK